MDASDMDPLALLRLQIEWGADEALEDAPVNRLRALEERPGIGDGPAGSGKLPLPLREGVGEGSKRGWGEVWTVTWFAPSPHSRFDPSPHPPPTRGGGVSAPPSTSAAERAIAAAGQAQNLDALRAALAAFDGCVLRDTAANLVFAAGDPDAGLLLIGDPPGEAEDRSGTPFAGPDGILLDRMLASVSLTRQALLCTPLIPWRPPGGRPPSPAEIAVCLPFLHRLIALAPPRRLVLAGPLAARTLLGTTRRRAGPVWIEVPVPGLATPLPALAMPGPAMVARTPSARREAWAALRLLRRTLDADHAGR